jgi:hypothetical protein
MHARQIIRDAAKADLVALPSIADRVYIGRTRALAAAHAPALLVYTTDENSEVDAQGADAVLARDLRLVVEARTSTAEVPDDLLDQIAAEVEPAMVSGSLVGLVREVTLVRTRKSVESDGTSHVGALAMEFRVAYRTRESAPGVLV